MSTIKTPAAADYLGMSVSTLEKSRVSGVGGPPYLKLGRSVRYRCADLDRWLEERVRHNTSAAAPKSALGHAQ
jgi:predicted DNA-binding transcriptional regulator AlpA